LRDAVIAGIEAALDRGCLLGDLNLDELEASLRHTMGVIGEQPRVFEYDLLRLEEGCDRALSHLAQAGLQWIQDTRQTAIPAGQICGWVAAFVDDQLREPLRRLRETSEQAILQMQQVATALKIPDTPAVSEVESMDGADNAGSGAAGKLVRRRLPGTDSTPRGTHCGVLRRGAPSGGFGSFDAIRGKG
jgi:hypothetical protein